MLRKSSKGSVSQVRKEWLTSWALPTVTAKNLYKTRGSHDKEHDERQLKNTLTCVSLHLNQIRGSFLGIDIYHLLRQVSRWRASSFLSSREWHGSPNLKQPDLHNWSLHVVTSMRPAACDKVEEKGAQTFNNNHKVNYKNLIMQNSPRRG